MASDTLLTLGAVFDVVDVMVRGRSDGASRRRAESERPRRAPPVALPDRRSGGAGEGAAGAVAERRCGVVDGDRGRSAAGGAGGARIWRGCRGSSARRTRARPGGRAKSKEGKCSRWNEAGNTRAARRRSVPLDLGDPYDHPARAWTTWFVQETSPGIRRSAYPAPPLRLDAGRPARGCGRGRWPILQYGVDDTFRVLDAWRHAPPMGWNVSASTGSGSSLRRSRS